MMLEKSMPVPINADFFESYPLYRSSTLPEDFDTSAFERWFPPISMNCPECQSAQTFAALRFAADPLRLHRYAHGAKIYGDGKGSITTALYTCARCQRQQIAFVIRIGDDGTSAMKIGQFPHWSVEPTAATKRVLGEFLEDFKKGLICESQSCGIAAFAYYRRVVDDTIGSLLSDIGQLLAGDPAQSEYLKSLTKVQASQSAEARLAVVMDWLPVFLQPGGVNPLAILHGALRDGWYCRSDADCLVYAEQVRSALTYLIERVTSAKEKGNEFSAQMQKTKKTLAKKVQTKTNV